MTPTHARLRLLSPATFRTLLRRLASAAIATIVTLSTLVLAPHAQAQNALPQEIRLDYAYYSPPSLVLKRFGWLEEALKADKVNVRWVLSQIGRASCRERV